MRVWNEGFNTFLNNSNNFEVYGFWDISGEVKQTMDCRILAQEDENVISQSKRKKPNN